MNELLGHTVAARRLATLLASAFGALALSLAAVGIYGVTSFAVSRRTREIAVRLALGAPPSSVLGMMLRRVVALTLGGLGLGLPMALGAARYLEAMLFGVEPMDMAAFGLAPVLLCTVSLAASLAPSRRALRLDPAAALRRD